MQGFETEKIDNIATVKMGELGDYNLNTFESQEINGSTEQEFKGQSTYLQP